MKRIEKKEKARIKKAKVKEKQERKRARKSGEDAGIPTEAEEEKISAEEMASEERDATAKTKQDLDSSSDADHESEVKEHADPAQDIDGANEEGGVELTEPTLPIRGKDNASDEESEDDDFDASGFEGLDEEDAICKPASTPTSKAPSPSFDPPQHTSGTSSISSLATQNGESEEKPAKRPKLEIKIDQEELKSRLQKRIAELRAARKADNEDGTRARSRSELIEQRRKKEEERKKNKKALRQQQREEERRQREEGYARGSPLMSPSGQSPAGLHGQSPLSDPANNFSFGRIAFENGQSMNASLNSVLDPHKKKGNADPKAALQMVKKKMERLDSFDAEKRADIEEKDMWLNARKRAQGEYARDDSSLLKKALKRKEKQKKKSEKEWNDRLQGVAQGQAARQKKREENLANRKEIKGQKGKGGKKAGGAKKGKKMSRPGFEGSFKAGR